MGKKRGGERESSDTSTITETKKFPKKVSSISLFVNSSDLWHVSFTHVSFMCPLDSPGPPGPSYFKFKTKFPGGEQGFIDIE